MIAHGTLCLVVGYHGLAGSTATVVTGPHYGWTAIGAAGEKIHGVTVYELDRFNRTGERYGALPCNLIPIAPPGIQATERERIQVAA